MKTVLCPACGARMKRNGHTTAGRQRWRCTGCGGSQTIRYDTTAARLEEFLSWLLSKDAQADMPGQGDKVNIRIDDCATVSCASALPQIDQSRHRSFTDFG